MIPNRGSAPITQAEMNEINSRLRDQLKEYNDRDHEAVNRHRQTVRQALEQDDDVIRIRFGGSVERHTYVEGASDVDALVIVNRSKLSSELPQDAIESMEALIRRRLPNTKIKSGDLAVTVTYSDGVEMQFLPAIERKGGFRIADPSINRWSDVTHPDRFRAKLTKVNQARAGQVIPAIKLMKGLANQVIPDKDDRISGYHMESIAIEAFRDYHGPTDLRSMVIHFCESASEIVLEPIRDSTGQSRNVDDYMKGARSPRRRRASNNFRRMLDRFSACRSGGDLDALFGNGGGQSDNPGGGGETPPRKPGGGGGRTAARTGAALSVPRERRYKPPSQYAAAMDCNAAPTREIYDLTPLSRANADWLAHNQPGMRCDDKRGVTGGTLAMRVAWDRSAGELVVNPKRPMPLTIEDAYEIDIHLRYEPRMVPIPNRSPRVFETGGRARALVGKKVASTIDLHMYFSGEMCLGINVAPPAKEIFDLSQFIEIDVISWLYRFAYVERFGLAKARKDLWREYDHYHGVEQHIAFLRDIASRNPSSRSLCPCGSRVKYARCHKPQVEEARRESWI